MNCQERVDCLKSATPALVMLLIVLGCTVAIGMILLGHLSEYAPYMDKLIGTLMIVAGLQQNETN